ncbi:sigma-54-dependent transcriptional regulator [Limisphaera sp. VF-2]|uniref:sigma-54-dependent transcriptional regulator n=1 Tax=Limisphaera sp. VF-2 TaxID=3400418 RepID=UPI0030978463
MKARILLVDDDPDMRELVGSFLSQNDYEVQTTDSAAGLRSLLDGEAPDVVLLDYKLPETPGAVPQDIGLTLMPGIRQRWPETEIIILSGHGTLDVAVEAGRLGAYTFISKPFELGKLMADLQCALEHKAQQAENSALRDALATFSGLNSPIFKSAAMQAVIRTVERIAPTDVTVLITGESGTGKEVIADLLHSLSKRNKNRIIKVNCAALPRELIESELFGSVKGAYTGAHTDREGLFRQAEGGTLFLDEISEMPVDTQSKLLRVLQDQEVRPIGSKVTYKTNCRIITATNRKPEEAIKEGKLREDLYYRISTVSIHLPPLRERRDDILPLAQAFLRRFSAQANRVINGFTPAAIDRLLNFDWPGNVRQLQNEIQRAVLLSDGPMIDAADLSIARSPDDTAVSPDTNFTLLEGVERNAIIQMLKATGGNKVEAARRLGIGRQTLYNKIKAYGIKI